MEIKGLGVRNTVSGVENEVLGVELEVFCRGGKERAGDGWKKKVWVEKKGVGSKKGEPFAGQKEGETFARQKKGRYARARKGEIPAS